MFDGKYFDWNQKRIKGIVDNYGYKFFYNKKILDLGCGYADLSGVLYRLGSDITAVDARQEHLKIVTKKFPGIKVVRANLDGPWPFFNQKFDMILDLGLICHLSSFEEHLKAVCASTNYLILETAVCDSEDPDKVIKIAESKEVYDLAYNGGGCRPSAAAIERVLAASGMTYRRVDNAKFNAGDYVYDWMVKGEEGANLNKRRMWFCSKSQDGVISPYIGVQPAVVVQPPSNTEFSFNQRANPTILSASPRPPMSARIAAGLKNTNNYSNSPSPLNIQITKNSKEFSLIRPEDYSTKTTFETSGIILPTTLSSKMWLSKMQPLFPNIKVSADSIGMPGFNKSKDAPNVVMCSIDNLVSYDRIWIEEWTDVLLDASKIETLKNCKVIMTPSLLNAQEILKVIPNANVQRVVKPWPMVPADKLEVPNFLYFEKDQAITSELILKSWNNEWGKLTVIGSSGKLPDFVDSIPDTTDYKTIVNMMVGARAIIDISNNSYYMSGILNLAAAQSLPIITNNQYYINQNNVFLIEQVSTDDIQKSINKFINGPTITPKYNEGYNNDVNSALSKILGV